MDTNTLSRPELTSIIVDAARCLAIQFGTEEKPGDVSGPALIFRQFPLEILYRTPKTMCLDAMSNFGIDVWHDNKKVFSACWNSSILKDFELISLKRGPWIPELLKKASLAGVDT